MEPTTKDFFFYSETIRRILADQRQRNAQNTRPDRQNNQNLP